VHSIKVDKNKKATYVYRAAESRYRKKTVQLCG